MQRTIPLTDESPLSIQDDDWPSIAHALIEYESGKCWLRVRQHADGRVLVYGLNTVRDMRAGGQIFAAGSNLAHAIASVGQTIVASDECIMRCISALPS